MKRKELINEYIKFFKNKKHKEIPNSSLIPENDPTVLFTTAGMHPLVPYLLGQKHPLGKRLVNVQKCIRTTDIEEVGDTTHHTFLEMLGNWSLGDYWKKEAIEYTFEFLTHVLHIPKEKIAVTCFKGNKSLQIPKDEESEKIWLSLGISKERIAFLEKDNWWGPAGEFGPCGPSTEIFYWTGKEKAPEKFRPEDKKWVEIGNDVLMEYTKTKSGQFKQANQKNIDFGGGVERTLAVLNGLDDNYMAEVFKPVIENIEKISKKKYENFKKEMRIIADHLKASVFIIADGITPSNTEQGYVLRRLIRRAVRYGKIIGVQNNFLKQAAEPIFRIYEDYSNLQKNKIIVLEELEKEENRFRQSLASGLKFFNKIIQDKKKMISGKDAFLLYQSYGFPLELIREEAKNKKLKVDEKAFEHEFEKHKELSHTSTKGRFKSGLADHSQATTRLHTAAHLLLSAIRKVLNDKDIIQKGSNINPERLRLDFSYPEKLTDKQIKQVGDLVNEKISESIPVVREEMSLQEAKKKGALGIFDEKYGAVVSVYTIGDFSKEICTGPHVSNTSEIGKLKITKQESVGAGVRRIKAVIE